MKRNHWSIQSPATLLGTSVKPPVGANIQLVNHMAATLCILAFTHSQDKLLSSGGKRGSNLVLTRHNKSSGQ